MIFAELHGKLGQEGSRAHERAEDVLTSSVFGLLRYVPAREGLLALLGRARPVRMEEGGGISLRSEPGWLEVRKAVRCDVMFWPHLKGHGEPDLLLRLLSETGTAVGVVLIEAKLGAPKGMRSEDAGGEERGEVPDPEQLVRYWQGLQKLPAVAAGAPATLLYLTAHGLPPSRELEASLRRAPGMRLGWLSWRDAWHVASAAAKVHLPAADLAALLAQRGLRGFEGFRGPPVAVPPRGAGFWRPSPWFEPAAQAGVKEAAGIWSKTSSPLFWSER